MADLHSDIYKIMDDSGLTPGTFLNAKKSMAKIVAEVRMKLLSEIMEYLKQQKENNGRQDYNG